MAQELQARRNGIADSLGSWLPPGIQLTSQGWGHVGEACIFRAECRGKLRKVGLKHFSGLGKPHKACAPSYLELVTLVWVVSCLKPQLGLPKLWVRPCMGGPQCSVTVPVNLIPGLVWINNCASSWDGDVPQECSSGKNHIHCSWMPQRAGSCSLRHVGSSSKFTIPGMPQRAESCCLRHVGSSSKYSCLPQGGSVCVCLFFPSVWRLGECRFWCKSALLGTLWLSDGSPLRARRPGGADPLWPEPDAEEEQRGHRPLAVQEHCHQEQKREWGDKWA